MPTEYSNHLGICFVVVIFYGLGFHGIQCIHHHQTHHSSGRTFMEPFPSIEESQIQDLHSERGAASRDLGTYLKLRENPSLKSNIRICFIHFDGIRKTPNKRKHSISGDFRQGLLLLMVQKSQTTTCGMPTSTGATAGFLVAINSVCPLFGGCVKNPLQSL